jgi:hypothetical protein
MPKKKKKKAKRNPRPRPRKTKKSAKRKAPRRNAGAALLAALKEGIGFGIGEQAIRSLRGRHKKKRSVAKRKPAKKPKPRRNPPAHRHAIAIGNGRRRRIIVGPKGAIQKLAGELRRAFGHSRVRTGKMVSKNGGR